jgi:hypothetical protein
MLFYDKTKKRFVAYEAFQGGAITYGNTMQELLKNITSKYVSALITWEDYSFGDTLLSWV